MLACGLGAGPKPGLWPATSAETPLGLPIDSACMRSAMSYAAAAAAAEPAAGAPPPPPPLLPPPLPLPLPVPLLPPVAGGDVEDEEVEEAETVLLLALADKAYATPQEQSNQNTRDTTRHGIGERATHLAAPAKVLVRARARGQRCGGGGGLETVQLRAHVRTVNARVGPRATLTLGCRHKREMQRRARDTGTHSWRGSARTASCCS